MRSANLQRFTMYYPINVIKEVDEVKNKLGYTSRASTMLYIIQKGIESEKNIKTEISKTTSSKIIALLQGKK